MKRFLSVLIGVDLVLFSLCSLSSNQMIRWPRLLSRLGRERSVMEGHDWLTRLP